MANFNGFRPSHRNKWLFVKNGALTLQELSLLEYYADQLDFDKKHRNYGKVFVDFDEIKEIFHCKSANTIRNWHNGLEQNGFVKKVLGGKREKYRYYLTCWGRYISNRPWRGLAEDYARTETDKRFETIFKIYMGDLQNITNKPQSVETNTQEKIDLTS